MKRIQLLTVALVALSAMPLAMAETSNTGIKNQPYTNYHSRWVDLGDEQLTPVQAICKHDEDDNVTIQLAKASGWNPHSHLNSQEYFDNEDEPAVTVSPNNKVEIVIKMKAHDYSACKALNYLVANHQELAACVRNSNPSPQELCSCVIKEAKAFNFRGHIPDTAFITPELHRKFVYERFKLFEKFLNELDVTVEHDDYNSIALKLSGKINTKEAHAIAQSLESDSEESNFINFTPARSSLSDLAWGIISESEDIDYRLVRFLKAALAQRGYRAGSVTSSVTKVTLYNDGAETPSFTYEKPALE